MVYALRFLYARLRLRLSRRPSAFERQLHADLAGAYVAALDRAVLYGESRDAC